MTDCEVRGCAERAKNGCAWCGSRVCDAHRVWMREEGESVACCYACFLKRLRLLFPEQLEMTT